MSKDKKVPPDYLSRLWSVFPGISRWNLIITRPSWLVKTRPDLRFGHNPFVTESQTDCLTELWQCARLQTFLDGCGWEICSIWVIRLGHRSWSSDG